ncbi:MAG TPA: endopeptidase La [Planctomycetota bacterium]|nr:endopeptidase La [Planctomycetota bacterium]
MADVARAKARPDGARAEETPGAGAVIELPERLDAAAEGAAGGEAAARGDELAIVPVRSMVLFPGVVLPLSVGRQRSLEAIEAALSAQQPIGLVLQKDESQDEPGPGDLHGIGTEAAILRFMSAEGGGHLAVCQGLQRFRVVELTATEPYLKARVERIAEPAEEDDEVRARFTSLKGQAREALSLMPGAPEEISVVLENVKGASHLADLVSTFIDVPPLEKQELLEILDLKERLKAVAAKLDHILRVLELSRDIRRETKGSLDKAQREFYLRQQLRTIQKELGEDEEGSAELEELSKRIEESGMSEEALREARRELARLQRMPQAAAEHSMIRTWLDSLVDLPWSRSSEDTLDLKEARRILDEDHYGLERVKRRILEFLAVKKLNPQGKSPILCLVGPPGVGKTSLGQSIARAMGRRFVRMSLGGVHDEAEIRGHRRTYIGAMPGMIVQGMRKAGSNNPVFMLDELDKLGSGFHGDPSAALLEVLDPEQNFAFRDNYLNVPFDLRRVMFIGTANVLEQIPRPLRDRCEVLQVSGYVPDEKLAIARRYLIPRQLEANGLKSEQVALSEAALERILVDYTREAGVRNLERAIGSVLRHAAAQIAVGEAERIEIEPKDLREILGAPKHEAEVAMRTSVPGVATGLAWTPSGGEILFIEATRMAGRNNLVMTGQLGDVMRESAQAALSLLKNRAVALGIAPEAFQDTDIHIHLPAGAIPKDGPSAGVAIYMALVSLFTGRTVKSDVAMTGEISLRGLVLPVGGIREKVLAAISAGIQTVLLPERNRFDLEEVPESARERVEVVWMETVEDAVAASLDGEQQAAEKREARKRKQRVASRTSPSASGAAEAG